MNVERELIIAVLKATKSEVHSLQVVSKDAKTPIEIARNILEKLQKDGFIYLRNDILEANDVQRLKLAVHAIQLGADIERVASFLQWQEFEQIVFVAFERNGYSVTKNLRFTQAGRKWEIDIVACKKPLAVCVDCKHWHKSMYPSALKKIVEEQMERTFALAEAMPAFANRIHCTSWTNVKLVPVILSLVTGRSKFHENVPIVSVLQIQDFLMQLPAHAETLRHFTTKLANQFYASS